MIRNFLWEFFREPMYMLMALFASAIIFIIVVYVVQMDVDFSSCLKDGRRAYECRAIIGGRYFR